ncbi:hypothetical protein SRH_02660 [Mesomycoplasma hyorhinis MCLD]|uniref:Uncharacterized protein n=1 Tax=Mesomycoplasma hyorhinis (strain MCLD) TaxID=936139 RepID=A0ABM5M6P4_MESHM|nr:hypothetical protein SRH_02660 [Mesomycoplasma hyorhinis MCLD]
MIWTFHIFLFFCLKNFQKEGKIDGLIFLDTLKN